MAGLSRPLRPAVLRHDGRGAVRDLPARHRSHRGRYLWRRIQMRGARPQAHGCEKLVETVAVCARRGAAAAIARGPDGALRGCELTISAGRPWAEYAATCPRAC